MKSRYPLLKLFIYLIAGYLVGYIFIISTDIILLLSVFVLLIAFLSSISRSVLFAFISLLIGLNLNSNVELFRIKTLDNHIVNSFDAVYKAEVVEVLTIHNSHKRFITEGLVYSSIFNEPHKCKSVFTLFDKSNKIEIKPGLEFISNSSFKVGAPKILNEDFNEKSYLISNKALFFATANSNNFSIKDKNHNISSLLYNIRSSIKNRIYETILDSNIAGVIIALTTGDKTSIDKETQNSFSVTGTAHVLAISGLHVGIFSLLVFTLIGPLSSRNTKFIIFSILVWLFVFLTGGQPSAMRAAFMTTFAAFLIHYGKVPKPINILLFTVILYIIIEPAIIYSVSFQLSVFAITGIVILYKPINKTLRRLFYYDNMLTRFVSSSFAISFAATIPTAILTAYYFNTFSITYPFANLLVLPIMTFASFQSILFVLFSSIGLPFADLFAKTAYLAIEISIKINTVLADFSQGFILQSIDLIYVSIITSLILLYTLTAKIIGKFIFRIAVSAIAIILLLRLETNSYKAFIILPREQSTTLLLENDSTVIVVMSDRKKYDYLNYDYSLVKHLKNKSKKVELIKTGNVSINFEDKALTHLDIESNYLNLNHIDSLSKRLNIDYLYRINEKYD